MLEIPVGVHVTDVNDNAPRFTAETYMFHVPEEPEVGTVLGRVSAYDLDLGQGGRVRYDLQGDLPNTVLMLEQVCWKLLFVLFWSVDMILKTVCHSMLILRVIDYHSHFSLQNKQFLWGFQFWLKAVTVSSRYRFMFVMIRRQTMGSTPTV